MSSETIEESDEFDENALGVTNSRRDINHNNREVLLIS